MVLLCECSLKLPPTCGTLPGENNLLPTPCTPASLPASLLRAQMSDTLGQIANAHVALADQHPLGAASEECKRLARLHAVAVD